MATIREHIIIGMDKFQIYKICLDSIWLVWNMIINISRIYLLIFVIMPIREN